MIDRRGSWQDQVEARCRDLGFPFHAVSPGTRVDERTIVIDYEKGWALSLEQTDPMNRDITVIVSLIQYEPVSGSYEEVDIAHCNNPHAIIAFVRGWIIETGEMDAEWDELAGQNG